MKQLALIVFIPLILVINSCTLSHFLKTELGTEVDKFENRKTNYLHFNFLPSKYGVASIAFDLQRIDVDDRIMSYSIIIRYVHADWLFIEQGESLVLLIDGRRIGFTSEGSSNHREVLSGGSVLEEAQYAVDYSTLQMLAHASRIEMKIVGDRYYVTREFEKSNFDNLRNFITRFPTK
ncbi:MAG: hypothetical protein NTZ35_08035 [Ignavibacteriales bacterium]|nr:hypothetical protein [Ignavibacteriales bacterium]